MEKTMKMEGLEYLKGVTRIGLTFTSIATTIFILRVLFQSAIKSLKCVSQVDCDDGLVLIYDIWWPVDSHHGLSFYLLMTWQIGNLALTTFSAAITDVFSCGVAFAAAERSKLLSKIAPTALLPTKHNAISKECRNWLRYHQYYLRIVYAINTTMGPIYFVAYVLGAVNIIALSYVSVKASDQVLLGQTIAILVIVFFRLYAIAYSGQKVYTQSAELSRCTLNAMQVSKGCLKEGPVRNILLVLATRLSGGIKPEQISGLGYFSISMDFFTKVLSISCSYLFILLQLQSQSNKKLNE